jgi:cytochrome c nitrite reductase small subunit
MHEQYDGWTRSSHHTAATCNDCHTPHSLVPKYYVKARNGFWHSFYFTVGGFPEPIRITPSNKTVTEESCRYCHQEIVQAIDAWHQPAREMSCIRCHDSVGHS